MIKYLGSKRTLISAILDAAGPGHGQTAVDVFSGTGRVAVALRGHGYRVIANDHNAYAATSARCYLEASSDVHTKPAQQLVDELMRLPGKPGYFTETFGRKSRYVHPKNGARIDAMRDAIDAKDLDPVLKSVMLVSLLEAADRVDSTCGVQMAYLKSWAARAENDIELRVPALLPSSCPVGEARQGEAVDAAALDGSLVYLDPPYNQHSYLGNYHVWESLVLWDKPDVYGIACKRVDCQTRKSAFNSKRAFSSAFDDMLSAIKAPRVLVSFNDEGFMSIDDMTKRLDATGRCTVFGFDYKRYVGAQIGIYNPSGERVGTPGKKRNQEHLFVVERDQMSTKTLPRIKKTGRAA